LPPATTLPVMSGDPRLQAWRTLLIVHAEVVDRLAAELRAVHDLPLSWYEVLLYLHESPEGRLRMHELAESLLLSRSSATRFVERMERAGGRLPVKLLGAAPGRWPIPCPENTGWPSTRRQRTHRRRSCRSTA